jgi:hypothetical protein
MGRILNARDLTLITKFSARTESAGRRLAVFLLFRSCVLALSRVLRFIFNDFRMMDTGSGRLFPYPLHFFFKFRGLHARSRGGFECK